MQADARKLKEDARQVSPDSSKRVLELVPAAPTARRAPRVEAGNDVNEVGAQVVVDRVRKAPEEGTSQPHCDLRKGFGEFGDQADHVLER